MSEEKKKTAIEKHYIGGHGNPLEFVKSSETLGTYYWTTDDAISATRKAAMCDEKDDREFMISLIDKISSLNAIGDELRLRFTTTKNALEKINNSLKEELDA